jgi:hypothetical protein
LEQRVIARQNKSQDGKALIRLVMEVMAPVRFGSTAEFEAVETRVNGRLLLQPVRTAMPEGLGDRPAVVILQFHQQPASHLGGVLAGLPAREAARDLSGHFIP